MLVAAVNSKPDFIGPISTLLECVLDARLPANPHPEFTDHIGDSDWARTLYWVICLSRSKVARLHLIVSIKRNCWMSG
jgi:hypothetical protein